MRLGSGPLLVDFGTAGASARREHKRLNKALRTRRHRTRTSAGFAGLLAPSVLPFSLPSLLTSSLALAAAAASWWAADRWFVQRHGTETGVSWRIGAEGEEATAELLTPLRRQGWFWLHDRAVPTRRFNLDHIGIPPSGDGLVVVETKKWPRTWQVSVNRGGHLVCESFDRPGLGRLQETDVAALIKETDAILPHTDLPVSRFIAVHGARVAGGRLTLIRRSPVLGADVTIEVVEAPLLASTLVGHADSKADRSAARRTAEWASGRFPRR
ncbi:nuclease-related domain-containing protein [Streptomyces pseudogriseolus]|uniref:nuclease-related domain-containing protein n=1 Tax=Streptomyces pseudogriseolus TaxID=36817 RepID=UPI003FA1CB25